MVERVSTGGAGAGAPDLNTTMRSSAVLPPWLSRDVRVRGVQFSLPGRGRVRLGGVDEGGRGLRGEFTSSDVSGMRGESTLVVSTAML